MAGGIEAVAASVSADLFRRLPRPNKKQCEGLALLVGTMLDVRSANLMALSASLPRESERINMRYQWISRLLGNELIDTDQDMAPFAGDVLQRASAGGQRLVLIIDQSKANDTQQPMVKFKLMTPQGGWIMLRISMAGEYRQATDSGQ